MATQDHSVYFCSRTAVACLQLAYFSGASRDGCYKVGIYIPVGSEVDFYLSSKDVVHGFNIAEKNINMMAIYGNINKTTVTFDEPGVYEIVCHEYCGVGHQNMKAQVIVNYPTAKK